MRRRKTSLPLLSTLFPLLLLLLLFPSRPTTASSIPTCPVVLPTPTSNARIVGGSPSTTRTTAFLAALHNPALFGTFQCTAVLLSPLWLLTAAHCNVSPRWSAHIAAPTAFGGQVFPIDAVFTPPLNHTPPFDTPADIALVKLTIPAPPNASFALVNPSLAEPIPFSFARAVGYGDIAFENPNPELVLRQVDVPVLPYRRCKDAYSYISHDRLCAGYMRGGCDSCQGDSGGPLFQFDDAAVPVVVALVSSGYRCAEPNFPGIYMRVAAFVDWMREVGAEFGLAQNIRHVMFSPTSGPSILPSTSVVDSVLQSPLPSPSSTDPDVAPVASTLPSEGSTPVAGVTRTPKPSLQYHCPVLLPDAPVRWTAVHVNGGQEVADLAASYLVAFADITHNVRCSGVLLSARWVLTSTRCGITEEWRAYVGSRFAGLGTPMAVTRVLAQPAEDDTLPRLALVQFPEEVPSRDAQFALVNEDRDVPAIATIGRFWGYGMSGANTSTDVFIPDSGVPARQLDLVVSSENSCRQWADSEMASQDFCALNSPDVPFCQLCRGDDGGPVVQFDASGNVIVVGAAIAVPDVCGIDTDPALFARTAEAVEWMRDSGVEFEVGKVSLASTAGGNGVRGSERSRRVLLASVLSGVIGGMIVTSVAIVFVLGFFRGRAAQVLEESHH